MPAAEGAGPTDGAPGPIAPPAARVHRAWAEGDITGAQVDVIEALRDDSTEEALVRDEATLVDHAATLRYDLFVRAAAYWKQLADPDGAEEDDEARHAQRDVYLARSFGGMWLGKITLDPISGSIVSGELERLERALFESDWAAARERLGHEPTLVDLGRTSGQRRADALVEMATRSQIAPADGRRPTPLFSVLIDYEALRGRVCELAEGTAIAPGSLIPWLDEAYLERVVFAPGRRVEVSDTARLFSGATRRAIQLRDRECTHDYCDVPVGVVPGRSHRPLHRRWPDHRGERAAAVWVSQPVAQRPGTARRLIESECRCSCAAVGGQRIGASMLR